MSGPNGSRSLSRTEHHRDKFGTDFVRYTPDGPWIMLGPPNTSSVQLPSAYGASLPPDSRLPSFRDMFSTVDLSFPGANGQVRDPHDLRNPSGLQGHVSDKLTQVPTPLAMRSHGNMDPSQVRLPDDNENDFPPAHVLLKNMAEPASRVAGCRHSDSKGKGKRRSASSPIPSSLKLPPKRHKVSAVESSASTLQKKRGRKEGSAKYKQLLKTSKPTGDAECPPHVERAHEIEYLINGKTGSRELEDEDIIDDAATDDSSQGDDSEVENLPPPTKLPATTQSHPAQGPVTRRPPSDRLSTNIPRQHRSNPQDILQSISSILSPEAQIARSEALSARSVQTTQIFTLTAQICDLQSRVDRLQSELTTSERARHDAER
ncbi:uncharacterized protein BT62DRAFT_1079753 [Guyanagaster necrorhizus]|uniref:DUF6818 domain-containing protein n=1 Tax=Guyanagaster necrorhizus TaxID=856835 RepID=A0A9P8ANG1_9AGAR|nr:uncharacterized protein BT62DRAFT_1079753 [Guyanagaster necrorhizus MCA 3950]KAG7441799.1 hypothetical protein BT62DRAFT_1079753 [Guyanagaster necrorhizus MCA 3950]